MTIVKEAYSAILNIVHVRHPVFSRREIFKWKGIVLSFGFVTSNCNVIMHTIVPSDMAEEGLALLTGLL